MKGTKLWQSAGSPIIQGRSRRQRPSWQYWLPAWVVSAVVVSTLLFLAPGLSGGSPWIVAGGMLGALLGAVAGVAITRLMGWQFPTLWGTIVGVGGAVVLIALGASIFSA